MARRIVEALPLGAGRVIEIGPGQGALTRHLLERFRMVRAIELDLALARPLARRLGSPTGLEVVAADALRVSLDELAAGGPWQLAGNLPYSVASPLIRRLLPRHDLFGAMVVMVQLEVARRLVAGPGTSERGLLSVEAEACCAAELLQMVPPQCFAPAPRVSSAVLRLTLREPSVPPGRLEAALRLVAEGFTHRRKMLGNALGDQARGKPIRHVLQSLGLDGARPQDLTLEEWVAIADTVAADQPGET